MEGATETKVQKIWREWAEKRRVDLIDLFPAFSVPGAAQYYIPRDGHWDEQGHRLVAEILLQNFDKIHPALK